VQFKIFSRRSELICCTGLSPFLIYYNILLQREDIIATIPDGVILFIEGIVFFFGLEFFILLNGLCDFLALPIERLGLQ
jgi:hypothetical protein